MNIAISSPLPATDQFALLPRGSLVVSCQAPDGHPLANADVIARLALCAQLGGAQAVRVSGVENIRAVRQLVSIPIVGITKRPRLGGLRPLITPTVDDVDEIIDAGADLVAIDASYEAHPVDASLAAVIRRGNNRVGLVMADVSTVAEGQRAIALGASMVGTTLSGYTPDSPLISDEPDLVLLERLVRHGYDAVLEGRVTTPDHVARARELGARAIVVGAAITDPVSITRRMNHQAEAGALL